MVGILASVTLVYLVGMELFQLHHNFPLQIKLIFFFKQQIVRMGILGGTVGK